MKKINFANMENVCAGDKAGFCKGFGAAVFVYEAGVLATLWNPIGWGGGAALLAVGFYCLT